MSAPVRKVWTRKVDAILQKYIPDRLKAISSRLDKQQQQQDADPDHVNKRRRLDPCILEEAVLEEAEYLLRYASQVKGWARQELLGLNIKNDDDEAVVCCKVVNTGTQAGEALGSRLLDAYVDHRARQADLLWKRNTASIDQSLENIYDPPLQALETVHTIRLSCWLQDIENAYMAFWEAASMLYKLRHSNSV